LASFDYV